MLKVNEYKAEKRMYYKSVRSSMSVIEKNSADLDIFNKIINTDSFKNAETILTYVSVNDETDTFELIKYCFENGKKVATPRCLDKNGNMSFFEINSFEDLKPSYFHLLEPAKCCNKIVSFKNSLCIVPAFSYDKNGYRIGYGGGYYDRFLSEYSTKTIGICYDRCIEKSHLHSEFDIKVDMVITDKQIFSLEDKNER